MATKLVKELRSGDRLQVEGGGIATVTSCKPIPIVQYAGSGGAWEIEYFAGRERGHAIQGGDQEAVLAD